MMFMGSYFKTNRSVDILKVLFGSQIDRIRLFLEKTVRLRTVLVMHGFYLLVLFLLFDRFNNYLFKESTKVSPVEFVYILSWFPVEQFHFFTMSIAVVGFISLFVCIFFPRNTLFSFLSFLSILFCIAIESSYGKVIHGYYGVLFSSIVFVFLSKRKDRDIQIIFCAQFSSVLCYTLAGLWKVRLIPSTFNDYGVWGLLHALGNTIAYEHVTYGYELSSLSQFFLNHDIITGSLFFSLIGLQCMAVILVFYTRFHFILGLFLILFHVLSELIVHIPFRAQLYLIVLFFCFSPFIQMGKRKVL